MGETLRAFLFDYTLRTVALGAAGLGAVAGVLGCFAFLRRQSLLGDAIAHAALPGIGLAFLLTGSRTTPVLVLGAAIAGWLATLLVLGIVRSTRLREDAALGIVLSVFFGFGLVVLTFVQRLPTASQAGLDTFLFGQAATLLTRDVVLILAVGSVALLLLVLFWKEFKLLAFDRDLAAAMGMPVIAMDVLLTTLLVVAIVIGLQTVGVVLMSALVVAPAAAARQWTNALPRMVLLAGVVGALSGVGGAVVSSLGGGIPTGPTIVLLATLFVAFSLLFAPDRGLAATMIAAYRTRRTVLADTVLADLLALAAQHEAGIRHAHPVAVLEAMHPRPKAVAGTLRDLAGRGLAHELGPGSWALTPEGEARARDLFRDREGEEERAR